MRNSCKTGGSVKKKYQAGGKVDTGKRGLDPKMSIDTFKKGTGRDMKMNPGKIQVGKTKPMTPAEKAKAFEKFKKDMGKQVGGSKFYTPKKQKGGVIVASPIQGRTGRRGAAGSNMAKGGQKFPDLTGDGRVTKKDILKGRGVLKKGGAKKYQTGGPSPFDQVIGALHGMANNTGVSTMKDVANATDQIKIEKLRRMGKTTPLGTDLGPKIDYLGRGKGSTDYYDEKYYGMSIPEATRLAVKAGEQKKKVTRAAHPSDVLGQKPAYLKKKGGQAHPGFKAVQAKIAAKQGVSKKAAGAILASATRKASAKAKAANPRLKRVKG